MNVILSVDEAHAILTLVSAQVLDNVELSEEAREAIRNWRRDRALGSKELDDYADVLNEALGNEIDERTTRFIRKRGSQRVSAAEERVR
jgi:hypothetical protein